MIQRKRCAKCGRLKVLDKFYRNRSKRDGHSTWCGNCTKEYTEEYQQTEEGKKTKKKAMKRFLQSDKNKDYFKKYNLFYCQSENGKEKRKKAQKQYAQTEKGKEVQKRYNQTIQRRIARNLRDRIRLALKGMNKSAHTIELLGCTIEEFLFHLWSLFLEGMTFENYGLWELDHIIPCAAFDLSDPKEQRKCFHYTNLQPLWMRDNLRKGSKVA